MSELRFVGLDVHAEKISVSVADADCGVRSHGEIANRLESIRKLIRKAGTEGELEGLLSLLPVGSAGGRVFLAKH